MTRGRHRRTERDGARHIAEQHHELRQALALIEATDNLASLMPLLKALRSDLAEHFADEEREDGLVQAVAPTAPRHLRRLEALMAEHAHLLASLDDLIQRGEIATGGVATQIVAGARDLTRRLARHEAAETALLTDAVFADIGGG